MAGKVPASVSVVVVGGGFAGLACTKELAKHGAKVTLVDKNNYHQFQPMLYQVATAQVAPTDIARPLRSIFAKQPNVVFKMDEVTSVDPVVKTVTCADGTTATGDYLVLAMGSQPNFFHIPGAEEHSFPLYTLDHANRLRIRALQLLEDTADQPALLDRGALTFVIIGAGATGVETAGAVADFMNEILAKRLPTLDLSKAGVYLIDPASMVLAPFSEHTRAYAAKVLVEKHVNLKLGLSVTEVRHDRVVLSDGSEILSRCVVWAGGIQGPALVAHSGLPQGRGGRIDVRSDLTVAGFPGVYVLGDTANTLDSDGQPFPQLGSVALQAGSWAAGNILADIDGKSLTDFKYRDKGIMAMIGRNAAVAEMGKGRHALHGTLAFAAWLGVHALLMSGVRQRIDAFIAWGWDYFSSTRAPAILDRPDIPKIDWGEEDETPVADVRVSAPPRTGGWSPTADSGYPG
jgi:NADH:ubiquinone reductase (H+-translocating)